MLATPEDAILLDERRHGIVLVRPLGRALVLAGAGSFLVARGWPLSVGGAVALAIAAALAVRAVWAWERTRVVLTAERLYVVHGTLRRRAAAVRVERVEAVEVEQSLLGRLLGYGTLSAGGLEIPFVAQPYGVVRLLH
ncbi:MAG: PH domain-containing protein [Gaiellaceae bacterium]